MSNLHRNTLIIKDALNEAGSHFVSVRAIAKDGSEKQFLSSQAFVVKHLIGDAASDSAQQAVATRALKHPNLVYMRDINKHRELVKGGMSPAEAFQKCSRCFDATRAVSLSANGRRWEVNADGVLVEVTP